MTCDIVLYLRRDETAALYALVMKAFDTVFYFYQGFHIFIV